MALSFTALFLLMKTITHGDAPKFSRKFDRVAVSYYSVVVVYENNVVRFEEIL